MKSMLKIVAAGVIAIALSSCVVHERRMPPGMQKECMEEVQDIMHRAC
jgi:hypothetical protein